MGRVRGGWRLLACALFLALAGCIGSSRASRFYTLATPEVREGPALTATGPALAVGPVEIPDYLDRQQIVTRTGTNELVIAEFDRWGSSLDQEVTRSLVSTLADRLASSNIVVSGWKSSTLPPVASAYRAAVSVARFDGVLGQSVVLHGRWELIANRDGKEHSLMVKEATVTEKIDTGGYEALVAAMQRALVRFGQDMADYIAAATQISRMP
jgi:uncharacterized protein